MVTCVARATAWRAAERALQRPCKDQASASACDATCRRPFWSKCLVRRSALSCSSPPARARASCGARSSWAASTTQSAVALCDLSCLLARAVPPLRLSCEVVSSQARPAAGCAAPAAHLLVPVVTNAMQTSAPLHPCMNLSLGADRGQVFRCLSTPPCWPFLYQLRPTRLKRTHPIVTRIFVLLSWAASARGRAVLRARRRVRGRARLLVWHVDWLARGGCSRPRRPAALKPEACPNR
eukprot:365187-Chlamydomonas_euryale.AAC.21